jgi:SAM-dependent methyltransferase
MSKKIYWDKFYKKNDKQPFEWLIEFKDLKNNQEIVTDSNADSILESLNLKGQDLTLLVDVGCGTSLFSYGVQSSLRYKSLLVCSDFSDQALSILKEKHESYNTIIDYVQCDGKNMPFRNDIFDIAIDKGYIDSLLKSSDMNTALENAIVSIENILIKIDSSNKKAFVLQITDETPELRLSLLDQIGNKTLTVSYTFKEIDLGHDLIYYCYFIKKK